MKLPRLRLSSVMLGLVLVAVNLALFALCLVILVRKTSY